MFSANLLLMEAGNGLLIPNGMLRELDVYVYSEVKADVMCEVRIIICQWCFQASGDDAASYCNIFNSSLLAWLKIEPHDV